jgi:hypothetical protein
LAGQGLAVLVTVCTGGMHESLNRLEHGRLDGKIRQDSTALLVFNCFSEAAINIGIPQRILSISYSDSRNTSSCSQNLV